MLLLMQHWVCGMVSIASAAFGVLAERACSASAGDAQAGSDDRHHTDAHVTGALESCSLRGARSRLNRVCPGMQIGERLEAVLENFVNFLTAAARAGPTGIPDGDDTTDLPEPGPIPLGLRPERQKAKEGGSKHRKSKAARAAAAAASAGTADATATVQVHGATSQRGGAGATAAAAPASASPDGSATAASASAANGHTPERMAELGSGTQTLSVACLALSACLAVYPTTISNDLLALLPELAHWATEDSSISSLDDRQFVVWHKARSAARSGTPPPTGVPPLESLGAVWREQALRYEDSRHRMDALLNLLPLVHTMAVTGRCAEWAAVKEKAVAAWRSALHDVRMLCALSQLVAEQLMRVEGDQMLQQMHLLGGAEASAAHASKTLQSPPTLPAASPAVALPPGLAPCPHDALWGSMPDVWLAKHKAGAIATALELLQLSLATAPAAAHGKLAKAILAVPPRWVNDRERLASIDSAGARRSVGIAAALACHFVHLLAAYLPHAVHAAEQARQHAAGAAPHGSLPAFLIEGSVQVHMFGRALAAHVKLFLQANQLSRTTWPGFAQCLQIAAECLRFELAHVVACATPPNKQQDICAFADLQPEFWPADALAATYAMCPGQWEDGIDQCDVGERIASWADVSAERCVQLIGDLAACAELVLSAKLVLQRRTWLKCLCDLVLRNKDSSYSCSGFVWRLQQDSCSAHVAAELCQLADVFLM